MAEVLRLKEVKARERTILKLVIINLKNKYEEITKYNIS